MLKFKGTPGGMWISLDPETAADRLLAEFAQTLETRVSFLASGELYLDTGTRPLTSSLVAALLGVTERLGLRVCHLGGGASRRRPEPIRLAAAKSAAPPRGENPARIVHRSLRNGQELNTTGDLVILGDVNAGATVRAGGDILVIGSLRGVAHAGSGGDAGRIIYAGIFAPTQLRIGNILATAPGRSSPGGPELARIEGGRIVVEAWPNRRLGTFPLPSSFFRPRREAGRKKVFDKGMASTL